MHRFDFNHVLSYDPGAHPLGWQWMPDEVGIYATTSGLFSDAFKGVFSDVHDRVHRVWEATRAPGHRGARCGNVRLPHMVNVLSHCVSGAPGTETKQQFAPHAPVEIGGVRSGAGQSAKHQTRRKAV